MWYNVTCGDKHACGINVTCGDSHVCGIMSYVKTVMYVV